MTLVRQRSGHRAQVTRLANSISLELAKDDPSIDILLLYQNELERQKEILDSLDDEYLRQLTSNEEVTSDDIASEVENASDIMMNIYTTLKPVIKIIKDANKPKVDAQSIKLPNLTLPRFNGDPLHWSKFWDLYRTAIHNKLDMSAPAKFQYLMSQLDGEAANLLSGFDQTEKEYEEAIKLLETSYGKPKLLIRNRLSALFDLITPTPTAAGLRL